MKELYRMAYSEFRSHVNQEFPQGYEATMIYMRGKFGDKLFWAVLKTHCDRSLADSMVHWWRYNNRAAYELPF